MSSVVTNLRTQAIQFRLQEHRERLQYEGYLRREEINAGPSVVQPSKRLFAKQGTVAAWCGKYCEANVLIWFARERVHWSRISLGSTRNGPPATAMALACDGVVGPPAFRGSLRAVSEWACRRRRSEKMDEVGLRRTPSARTIARLMTTGRDALSKAETLTIATIEDSIPALVEARAAVAEFHYMIRKKAGEELDGWIERARTGLLASFANGDATVQAAPRG